VRPERVLAVILGGGQGRRLYPLTRDRAKPAVPLAGKYRLVDIPISNCLNSGLTHIFILTQFNSFSLNRHVMESYRFEDYRRGFVQTLAAQQTPTNKDWFQGTADAVRQTLPYVSRGLEDLVLVLAGDQLYRMDFRDLIGHHNARSADVTIAALRVRSEDAPRYGVLQADGEDRIVRFVEKPNDPEALGELQVAGDDDRPYLASMGIYLFRREVLVELLESEGVDFGRELIPRSISRYRVSAYPFSGYWEDIGTIGSFHRANLDLTGPHPSFELLLEESPWFTRARHLPPSKSFDCRLDRVLLAEGCLLEGVTARRSVIGLRSRVGPGTVIEESILMGADWFEPEEPGHQEEPLPLGIGRDCLIRRAIIDKNARIGDRVRIENRDRVQEAELPYGSIRDGIVVIPRNMILPAGTVI